MSTELEQTVKSIADKCQSGNFTFNDLSEIVTSIQFNLNHINKKVQIALLEPLYKMLLNHGKLSPNFKKKKKKDDNSYLMGNLQPSENGVKGKFSSKYRDILNRDSFDLSIIILMFRDLLDNYDNLADAFNLRDIEVTMRDDVIPIDQKAFIACGQKLAQDLINALNA